MNSPAPGARRGAHRSSRDAVAAAVPSLLAVLAVSALIVALVVWRGEETDPTRPANVSDPAATSPATSAPPGTTPPASRPPATASPSAPVSSGPAAAPVGDLQVVVLNQTRRGGLAGTVAQVLRTQGWTVSLTGNFRGQVPATTVYYPPGAQSAALAAAAALPTEPRVRPRFGNLSTTRLTVVVTDSYPS